MDALQQQLIFSASSLVCAGIGSVHDVRERRIPNRITVPAMIAGLALHTIAGGWQGLGNSALAGAAAGGIFLLFYMAGGMGAGDVKLMIAVGCLVGLAPLPVVVIATAMAGAIFAIAVSLVRGRLRETLRNVGELLLHHGRHGVKPHEELNLSNAQTLRLPFALPIAAGCLCSFCAVAWGLRP
jgi:prepilin peptidase CpaA